MSYEPEQKLEPDFDEEMERISEQADELLYQIDKQYDYISSFFSELSYAEIEERVERARDVFIELEDLRAEYDYIDDELSKADFLIQELEGLLHEKELEKDN